MNTEIFKNLNSKTAKKESEFVLLIKDFELTKSHKILIKFCGDIKSWLESYSNKLGENTDKTKLKENKLIELNNIKIKYLSKINRKKNILESCINLYSVYYKDIKDYLQNKQSNFINTKENIFIKDKIYSDYKVFVYEYEKFDIYKIKKNYIFDINIYSMYYFSYKDCNLKNKEIITNLINKTKTTKLKFFKNIFITKYNNITYVLLSTSLSELKTIGNIIFIKDVTEPVMIKSGILFEIYMKSNKNTPIYTKKFEEFYDDKK